MITAETLASVRVLYRDRNLQLWGIPYEMRPGQAPRHLQDAGNTTGWIWLGSPGWYGHMSKDEQEIVRDYLARSEIRPAIPLWWFEWSDLTECES